MNGYSWAFTDFRHAAVPIQGSRLLNKWGQSAFILWLEGCLVMTCGVHVLDVPWQQEEKG